MHFFTFEIVIEREAEDEGCSAYSPTLPGCFSNGKTIQRNPRQHLAKPEGVSMNQLIASAAAEKLSTFLTPEYLGERAPQCRRRLRRHGRTARAPELHRDGRARAAGHPSR